MKLSQLKTLHDMNESHLECFMDSSEKCCHINGILQQPVPVGHSRTTTTLVSFAQILLSVTITAGQG